MTGKFAPPESQRKRTHVITNLTHTKNTTHKSSLDTNYGEVSRTPIPLWLHTPIKRGSAGTGTFLYCESWHPPQTFRVHPSTVTIFIANVSHT